MRRVVLIHTTGAFTGLYQICGAWDAPLPAHLGAFELVGEVMGRAVRDAVLERVTERTAFYKEEK